VWFHVIGVTAFVIILPAIAPTHQPASWVFGTFAPDKAYTGVSNQGFTFLLALLGSQWAMVRWAGNLGPEFTRANSSQSPVVLVRHPGWVMLINPRLTAINRSAMTPLPT
jgi:hypothetical protein